MIDTKELRQLAQDATPGPWFSDARGNIWRRPLSDLYENGGSVAGDKPIAFVFVGWRGEGVTGYPVENNARLIAAANPATISELLDRLEAAEKENVKLREALAEKVTSETMLRDLSVGNGSINASFEGGAVHLFVDSLANQFVESGAANYLEMRFHSEATGPLLLTLQRVNGKTPHQLRTDAEKERDILRARVAAEI